MFYSVLADTVSTVHLLLMVFVVLGQVAILLGIVCRWDWIRNPWFRWLHLAAILTVAAEAVLNINCPLTDWEDDLRVAAGEQHNELSFTARVVHALLIPDFHEAKVEVPLLGTIWVLDLLYYGFAVLVVLSFVLAPPWRRSPRGRLACRLGCGGSTGSNGPSPRCGRAEVLVDRPARGAATETVVCPECREAVAIRVRSRRRFWAIVGLLALAAAAVAAVGLLLGAPAAEGARRSVLFNTVTVVGLVLLLLAPSGLLIRQALLSRGSPSSPPGGRRHRLIV
jgi:hypothetical protein